MSLVKVIEINRTHAIQAFLHDTEGRVCEMPRGLHIMIKLERGGSGKPPEDLPLNAQAISLGKGKDIHGTRDNLWVCAICEGILDNNFIVRVEIVSGGDRVFAEEIVLNTVKPTIVEDRHYVYMAA